jgi:hypothetical protein
MRRAKKPPAEADIVEATVLVDILTVGRRAEVAHLEPRINQLVMVACAEYLRQFPKARKMNNDPWVEMPQYEPYEGGGLGDATGETDFQCFFCRKSLNTMSRHRIPNKSFRANLRTSHIDECALRFLIGMMTPNAPLKHGAPGL